MGSISPVSKTDVLKAIETAESLAREYVSSGHGTLDDRYELCTAAQEMTDACGTLGDRNVRMMLEGPCATAALMVAVKAGWGKVLLEREVVRADELVRECGGEKNVVVRIMRVLTASRIATEVDREKYAGTEFMKAILQPGAVDMFGHSHDTVYPTLCKLPLYLTNTSFKEPADQSIGPTAYTHGKPLWKLFEDEPWRNERFNRAMTANFDARGKSSESFDFEEKVAKLNLKADDVFLVDIGGGLGHQTKMIKDKFPRIPGRTIVQDLPHVIKHAAAQKEMLDAGIEFQGHDMFTPEPVKGAAFYMFAAVFHDWADEPAVKILKNVKQGMKPGYSRLLIFDWVLPDVKATLRDASMDLWMMVECCGKERTAGEWENLLSQADLRIVEIHRKSVGAMIEVELTQ